MWMEIYACISWIVTRLKGEIAQLTARPICHAALPDPTTTITITTDQRIVNNHQCLTPRVNNLVTTITPRLLVQSTAPTNHHTPSPTNHHTRAVSSMTASTLHSINYRESRHTTMAAHHGALIVVSPPYIKPKK